MKAFKPFFFIMILILAVPLLAKQEQIICPACSTVNVPQAVYCRSCGFKLIKEKKRPRPESNNLFMLSTANVLPSLDIQLAGGGAYGLESEQMLLGNIGIGLGGVSELNLSTYSLFNNLGRQGATIPTSMFKYRVFTAKGFRPALAVGFRISTSSSYDRKSVDFTMPADSQGRTLASINYETRFTEANVSATLPYKKTQTTASLRVLDIRFSKLSSNWEIPYSTVYVKQDSAIDKNKANYSSLSAWAPKSS